MKKSLLALAALGAFAGVAHAQSSVTLYGIIDEGFNINTNANVVYDQNRGCVEQPSRHKHFLRVSAAQADDAFFREGGTDSKAAQNSPGVGTFARVRERPQTADGR